MNKTAQQSLFDILVQIMPALQDVRMRMLKKDDPNHKTLLSMWENAGNTNQRKFVKPANINPLEIKGLEIAGLIEDQGKYIKVTEKGAETIKVMILNDNTFALSKKSSTGKTGWYHRLKNENYLS
mgnify:CR=1 FL=1